MKKLFFIPAILFVVLISILVSNDIVSSKVNKPATNVNLGFQDKSGNPLNNVVGCFGGINYNSGSHSYVSLPSITPGSYPTCGAKSGAGVGNDVFVVPNQTFVGFILVIGEQGSCPCQED